MAATVKAKPKRPNPSKKDRKDDEFRWRESSWTRKRQWERWERVGLDPTLDLNSLVLNWQHPFVRDLDIIGAITDITITRSITEASSVEISVKDPRGHIFNAARGRMRPPAMTAKDKKLARKGRLTPVEVDEGWDPIIPPNLRGRAVEIVLNGVRFRLVKASSPDDSAVVKLTFEDTIMYLLKRKKGERRISRAKATRAQFVLSMLREIKLIKPPFICPELMVKQPIAKPEKVEKSTTDDATTGGGGEGGFPDNKSLTFMTHDGARVALTGERRRNAEAALSEADEITNDLKPRLALVMAISVESGWVNHDQASSDQDSQGVLQVRESTNPNGRDTRWAVREFLTKGFYNDPQLGGGGAIAIAKRHPDASAGRVAQATQGSAYPERYDRTKEASMEILDAWGGGSGTREGEASSDGGSFTKSFQYTRGKTESSYTAIKRLAEEVNWRFFTVGNAVYFMSEEQLYNRRPRYEFTPDDPALLTGVRYDIDWGKPVSEASFTVSLDRWGAPPGAVVLLNGFGPPDGRWLISEVKRNWFEPVAEVNLIQPGAEKMEPAHENSGGSTSSSESDNSSGGEDGSVEKLKEVCKKFNGSYLYGGSHGPKLSSLPYNAQYDCSSSTSKALKEAGMFPGDVATDSNGFANWGQDGPGDDFTVYYNPGHVFIQGNGWRFDTGGPGGGNGPRYREQERPTGGFNKSHWRGS
jgi:hypothetical protein